MPAPAQRHRQGRFSDSALPAYAQDSPRQMNRAAMQNLAPGASMLENVGLPLASNRLRGSPRLSQPTPSSPGFESKLISATSPHRMIGPPAPSVISKASNVTKLRIKGSAYASPFGSDKPGSKRVRQSDKLHRAMLRVATVLAGSMYSTARIKLPTISRFRRRPLFGNFIKFSQALQLRFRIGLPIIRLINTGCAVILHEKCRNSSL